jgi:hypothetical protein
MAVWAYSTLLTVTGRACSPELLVRMARMWGWRPTLLKVSCLAVLVADDGPRGDSTRAATIWPLAQRPVIANEVDALVVDYVRAHGSDMVVAHGEMLFFLQALALLYGTEEGREPTDRELAYWMLAAGDHLQQWQAEPDPQLTSLESGVAVMARASLFTSKEDVARSLARARLLFGTPPKRGSFSAPAEWALLQEEAFGCSFGDYLDEFVTPLTLSAVSWGSRRLGGGRALPIINPSSWLAQTRLDVTRPLSELAKLVISREQAQTELQRRLTPEGLPRSPAFFYRRPFVRLEPDSLVALSPTAVYGHLRAGIWSRFLGGAKRLRRAAEPWFEAFGHITEQWCQEVARDATGVPACPDHVVQVRGAEVEDLVLANGNAVALFSVKSRMMSERYLRQASSPRDVISWLDDVLFRERAFKSDRHRPGALRLLDAAVARIRAGRFEPEIGRGVEIFPVLVTFEEVFDSHWLQRWVAESCARFGLFAGDAVRPVAIASVSTLEELLGMAAHGVSVLDVLRAKAAPDWRERPLQHVMARMSKGLPSVRSPIVEATYRDMMNRSAVRMFGRELPD